MTAMDILEALGQTQEELLCDCDERIAAQENGKAGILATVRKYRRTAAGLLAAAAVLLLVYVGSGAYIRRSFDSGSSGASQSTSTAESAEISADTAEEEFVVEEPETVEMEEELTPESASDEDDVAATDSEGEASAAKPETGTEETQTTTDEQSEALALEMLKLGDVYIPGFAASGLSDREYEEWMELAALVQEEIDFALSQEDHETLPVYRFVQSEESTTNQTDDTSVDTIKKLDNYPVITGEEAEKLLRQGYYLSPADFSGTDIGSSEVASVELVYLISTETQIYMPYYQFTVVVDDDMVSICCVPAVSGEYLEGTLNRGAAE